MERGEERHDREAAWGLAALRESGPKQVVRITGYFNGSA